MQILSTINSFVQLQGTSYYKKNNFTLCPGKSRENSINIFQDFPGLTNKIQGLSRTFQDSKKNPGLSRTFPGCGNPGKKYNQIHGAGIWVWVSNSFRYDHLCFLSSVDICCPRDLEFFFAMVTASIEAQSAWFLFYFLNRA